MTALLFAACWALLGFWAATRGVDPRRRHPAWAAAGILFGPLWMIIQADQERAEQLPLATIRRSRLRPTHAPVPASRPEPIAAR